MVKVLPEEDERVSDIKVTGGRVFVDQPIEVLSRDRIQQVPEFAADFFPGVFNLV